MGQLHFQGHRIRTEVWKKLRLRAMSAPEH